MLVAMISSTTRDLPRHREAAIETCLNQGVRPHMMEHAPPTDRDPVRYSLDLIDEAVVRTDHPA
jgi:hypothetical protein